MSGTFLNVPIEIKNLLKSDSIKKNIRVEFPNGEWTDLINKDVVAESLEYTESIMSGDTFTLGIMESPVIKFETINIPNVKNATINVYIEVFCDSEIEGAVQRADLNDAYVYPIPLGVFMVTDCELQADLNHRIITGYSTIINDDLIARMDYINSVLHPWDDNTIPVSIDINDLTNLATNNPTTYEETISTQPPQISGDESIIVKNTDGQEVFVRAEYDVLRYEVKNTITHYYPYHDGDTIRQKEFTYIDVQGDFSELIENYAEFRNDAYDFIFNTAHVSPAYESQVMRFIDQFSVMCELVKTPVTYNEDTEKISDSSGSVIDLYPTPETSYRKVYKEDAFQNGVIALTDKKNSIFNYILRREQDVSGGKRKYTTYITENMISIPTSVIMDITIARTNGQAGQTYTITLSHGTAGITSIKVHRDKVNEAITGDYAVSNLYEVSFPRDIVNAKQPRVKINYNSSQEITSHSNVTRKKEYTADLGDISKFKMREMIGAKAELNGMIARIDRYGNYHEIRVDLQADGLMPTETLVPSVTLYPYGVNGGTYFPINYISCWYDDLTVRKFGRIICNYNNEEGEKSELIYNIVDDYNDADYKTYIIANNWILDNSKFTEAEITNILATMGENIKNAMYVPSKIELQGRPDVECGEFINVVTTDGNSFNSLVMRRTLKGIQALRDSLENNPKDDKAMSSTGSGGSGSSAYSGGGVYSSGVKSVNGYSGNVTLKTSDIEDDIGYAKSNDLTISYNNKTLYIGGFTQ